MKLKIFISIIGVITMFGCTNNCPSKEQVSAGIKKMMPVNFEVAAIKSTKDIPGICEVVVTVDKQPIVFYMDKKVHYIISGSIIDLGTKKNLTLEEQKAYKH